MIKTDCHTHTHYSFDSTCYMSEMAQRAIELQLTHLMFTDHIDFSYPTLSMLHPLNFRLYRQEFEETKENYGGKLHLGLGLEIGIGSQSSEVVLEVLKNDSFDFVIGSLHDHLGVDFYYPEFYTNRTKQEAYFAYFDEMIKAIKECKGIHVVGHIGYIERYGRYPDKSLQMRDYQEVLDALLKTIIENGLGLEINTSGFRYGLGQAHPQYDIIKRYLALGGELITVGSDAHKPEHIATHFKEVDVFLQEIGIGAVSFFKNGKPYFVDIGHTV